MFCLHFAPPEFCTNIKCAVSLLAESSSPETNQQYRTKPQILCLIQNHILHNFEVSSHPLRLEEHARGNGHRHQLLEQQLACVRYCDLRYLGLVLATKAVKGVLLQIGHSNEPTQLANVNLQHSNVSSVERHNSCSQVESLIAEPIVYIASDAE